MVNKCQKVVAAQEVGMEGWLFLNGRDLFKG